MTKLSDLTDEELDQAIALKKQQSKQKSKDYSKQSERGVTDLARDFAYGAVKAPWDLGKTMGNILTAGHLEDIPGYKQYIPWMEENIENIKSPKASAWGDLAQTAGGLVGPGLEEYLFSKAIGKPSLVVDALKKTKNLIPGARFKEEDAQLQQLIEQRNPRVTVNPKHFEQISNLFKETKYDPSSLIEEAAQGSHEAHDALLSDLFKFTKNKFGETPISKDFQTQAARIRNNYLKEYLKRLSEEAGEDVAKLYQRRKSGYAAGKKAKHAVSNAASLVGKADIIAKALKAVIGQ